MNVELEHGLHDPHTNVGDDNPHVTAKITLFAVAWRTGRLLLLLAPHLIAPHEY